MLLLLQTAAEATAVVTLLPKTPMRKSEGVWSFREISAFEMPDDFLQCTAMPFGMRNAPATFQRLVTRCCLVEAHLDDVYSDTWLSRGEIEKSSQSYT